MVGSGPELPLWLTICPVYIGTARRHGGLSAPGLQQGWGAKSQARCVTARFSMCLYILLKLLVQTLSRFPASEGETPARLLYGFKNS